MIRAMQVSVQQATGWFYDPFIGWYYLDADGQKYPGNPANPQFLVPLAFFPKYEIPATSIGGPIYVVKGNNVRVNWNFTWQGEAGTIVLRMGGCVKVLANYDEIGSSVIRQNVSVTASPTPKSYSGSSTFPYNYVTTAPKHLFILAESKQYEVVYTNAFVESAAEISELKVTSYSRV